MAKIKEMAECKYPKEDDVWMYNAYIDGANAVLDAVENFINNLDLGNGAEEKFYKLDAIADIGLYIKQLKGE